MVAMLRCGPLDAQDGEGRRLFSAVMVTLEEGCLTVLEGPSGGGKSTLLRQLAGLAPVEGALRELSGRRWDDDDLPGWRAAVTLMMQDAPVIPGSILDNLDFPYTLKASKGREFDAARAEELLDDVGLGSIALDRPVVTLSGGERHRMALVRTLLWDPPVVLADEPLSGLDGPRAERCFELLGDQARRPGHAVLCVLHDPQMGHNADRRLSLNDSGLSTA